VSAAPKGAAPAVSVVADLRLVSGGRTATRVGDGRRLTFTSDAARELLAGGPAIPLSAVGRIADVLGQAQLELVVIGPKGEIARLGSGASSWWARAVTGSRLVEVGSIRVVGPLALTAARQLLYRLASRALPGRLVARSGRRAE
jgi:hypothetical protein